jgi:hypothetical protein
MEEMHMAQTLRSFSTLSIFTLVTACVLAAPAMAQDAAVTAEVTTAHGYASGAPVDPATTFTRADGRVMVAIAIENPSATETEITVQFQRADQPVGTGTGGTHLTVPGRRHYHTVARTGTSRPGAWRAVVRAADGTVIGQVEYTVTE